MDPNDIASLRRAYLAALDQRRGTSGAAWNSRNVAVISAREVLKRHPAYRAAVGRVRMRMRAATMVRAAAASAHRAAVMREARARKLAFKRSII